LPAAGIASRIAGQSEERFAAVGDGLFPVLSTLAVLGQCAIAASAKRDSSCERARRHWGVLCRIQDAGSQSQQRRAVGPRHRRARRAGEARIPAERSSVRQAWRLDLDLHPGQQSRPTS